MIRTIVKRIKKNERGAAIIEFALVLPLLLVLVIGLIEFGWIFNGWIILTGAAREGARTAITNQEEAIVIEMVDNHAADFPGGYSAEMDLSGERITVTVTGTLPSITGVYENWFGSVPQITAKAESKRYYKD